MKDRPNDGQTSDNDNGESALLPAEELVPSEEEEAKESEVEVLSKELALLEGQLQDMRDRYLRTVADLDNYRKRVRREVKEAQHRAAAGLLLDFLPIVDSLERALGSTSDLDAASEETKAIHQGVAMIHRQLADLLSRRGVRPIEAVGERFDPGKHEAVAQVPAGPGQEEGVVALEVQRGYTFGDQVLRPSKVGVTVHPSKKE